MNKLHNITCCYIMKESEMYEIIQNPLDYPEELHKKALENFSKKVKERHQFEKKVKYQEDHDIKNLTDGIDRFTNIYPQNSLDINEDDEFIEYNNELQYNDKN